MAVSLITALLDDMFRHSAHVQVSMWQSRGPLYCTIATEARDLPASALPGPQRSWVPHLDQAANSWSFTLSGNPASCEVSFVLSSLDFEFSYADPWALPDATSEPEALDLTAGVRISRDQQQLFTRVCDAVVQLTGASSNQTLFPKLGLTALINNVFQHTDGDAIVTATLSDGVLRVEVADNSHRLPKLQSLNRPGQGIALVHNTAHRWGVRQDPHGKTTWFEYNLTAGGGDPESDLQAETVAGVLDGSHDWSDGPVVLNSGTNVELTQWLHRTWRTGLDGFHNADPKATRQLVKGLDHLMRRHREIIVRKVTIGKVADNNGVHVEAFRDEHGGVVINVIRVDPSLVDPGSTAQDVYRMIVGAAGSGLVKAGVGIERAGYHYLLRHFTGRRPELGDKKTEAAFEIWVREQLGEAALPPMTRMDRIKLRTAASKRFDIDRAASAAVADVEVKGWDHATDASRALYRLLFAQVRIDAEARGLIDAEVPRKRIGLSTTWGKDHYATLRVLTAAFTREHHIPVSGTEGSSADPLKLSDFFEGLHGMLAAFPDVYIAEIGIRDMPREHLAEVEGNKIFLNPTILQKGYSTTLGDDYRYGRGLDLYKKEAQLQFAKILVADLGPAILDDVLPVLLARWLHGRDKGHYRYQRDFSTWMKNKFRRHSYRLPRPHALIDDEIAQLDPANALAESVVQILNGGDRSIDLEISDGHEVLNALVRKYRPAPWTGPKYLSTSGSDVEIPYALPETIQMQLWRKLSRADVEIPNALPDAIRRQLSIKLSRATKAAVENEAGQHYLDLEHAQRLLKLDARGRVGLVDKDNEIVLVVAPEPERVLNARKLTNLRQQGKDVVFVRVSIDNQGYLSIRKYRKFEN